MVGYRPGTKPGTKPRTKKEQNVPETTTYEVPGMSCDHCTRAVTEALSSVPGVRGVDVDLDSKVVSVSGDGLEDRALRAAIEDAGYEAM